MNDSPLDRRTVLLGAAWATPVIAMAVATPLAAASGCPDKFIPSTSSAIHGVTIQDTGFLVHTKAGQGNAIDTTLRGPGQTSINLNLVTQGKNPGDNQQLYTPGTTVPFATARRPSLAKGDFLQVIDVHLSGDEDC